MVYDQSIKQDKGKIRLSLCFKRVVEECARVREFGLTKYKKNTWRDVEIDRYMDAALRHLFECKDDYYKKDSESGIYHLSHALWNIGAILELEKDYHGQMLLDDVFEDRKSDIEIYECEVKEMPLEIQEKQDWLDTHSFTECLQSDELMEKRKLYEQQIQIWKESDI